MAVSALLVLLKVGISESAVSVAEVEVVRAGIDVDVVESSLLVVEAVVSSEEAVVVAAVVVSSAAVVVSWANAPAVRTTADRRSERFNEDLILLDVQRVTVWKGVGEQDSESARLYDERKTFVYCSASSGMRPGRDPESWWERTLSCNTKGGMLDPNERDPYADRCQQQKQKKRHQKKS